MIELLAKRPEDRPGSASEVRKRLESLDHRLNPPTRPGLGGPRGTPAGPKRDSAPLPRVTRAFEQQDALDAVRPSSGPAPRPSPRRSGPLPVAPPATPAPAPKRPRLWLWAGGALLVIALSLGWMLLRKPPGLAAAPTATPPTQTGVP